MAIRNDDREDVIEIMRDPARQRADRFHFLRLAQLFLQPLLGFFRLFSFGYFATERGIGLHQFLGAFGDADFQFAPGFLQFQFGLAADGNFPAQRGVAAGDLLRALDAEPGQATDHQHHQSHHPRKPGSLLQRHRQDRER